MNTIDEDLLRLSDTKGALMEMFSLEEEVQDTSIPALPECDEIPQSPTKPGRPRETKEQRVSFKDAEFERRRTQLLEYVQEFQTSHISQEPSTRSQAGKSCLWRKLQTHEPVLISSIGLPSSSHEADLQCKSHRFIDVHGTGAINEVDSNDL